MREISKLGDGKMQWQQQYVEALVDALHPTGTVLEVGFNNGYAAEKIAKYPLKAHVIIESDPNAAKKAISWAKHHPHVSVLCGPWQELLPSLGTFDAIFFQDYSVEEMAKASELQQKGILTLKQGEDVLHMAEKMVPNLKTILYSDQDLEDFYQIKGKLYPKETSYFLQELKRNGQIDSNQYEKMMKKYALPQIPVKSATEKRLPEKSFLFLKACLDKHMHKGSRFSCFSPCPLSKYEDPLFFDDVITNPQLDYQERTIPIEVSPNCSYYKYQEALVLVIQKMV